MNSNSKNPEESIEREKNAKAGTSSSCLKYWQRGKIIKHPSPCIILYQQYLSVQKVKRKVWFNGNEVIVYAQSKFQVGTEWNRTETMKNENRGFQTKMHRLVFSVTYILMLLCSDAKYCTNVSVENVFRSKVKWL